MRERLRKQEGFNVELINYSKDGREYWVEIEVMPIRNEEGVVTGFFSLERDRTAERAAEIVFAEAQRRSQAQVAAIDRVQDAWNSNLMERFSASIRIWPI